MKIRMHFPTTEEGKEALQERIAEVHVKMIKHYINKLECSPEEKVRLFDEIKEDIKVKAEGEMKAGINWFFKLKYRYVVKCS